MTAQASAIASPPDVLDVREAAELLRVERKTVYAMAAANVIPHRRVGRLLRFSRAALLAWLAGHATGRDPRGP